MGNQSDKRIPRTCDDKIKVWMTWAKGTPWIKIPAVLSKEFDLTEYRCRMLKQEFEELTVDDLSKLENFSELLIRHPRYEAYKKRKARQTEESSKANVNAKFLEDHYKVLSTTALSIADLVHNVGIDNGEQTIGQIVDELGTWRGGGDPPVGQFERYEELSDLLSSTEAKWLLSHIKSEAPALFIHYMYTRPKFLKSVPYKKPKSKNIDRWEEMTQDDVSAYGEKLIDLLKLRAGRLDFQGTCEYCDSRK